MRPFLVLVAAASLLSGCVLPTEAEVVGEGKAGLERLPVIALIDSGVIPYYDVFRIGARTFDIPSSAVEVPLTWSGNISDRLKADAEFWERVRPGVLYHFGSTRLLGISFDDHDLPRRLLDVSAHGQAVTYLAARDAPHALVVSIQVNLSTCDSPPCLFHESVAQAMEWVADQPWIDIVSSSLGYAAAPPSDPDIDDVARRWLAATRLAVDRGKLVLNAAGNEVVPGIAHDKMGPPWVIAVGGVEPEMGGDAIFSSKAVDVVANFSDIVPRFNSVDEMRWTSGTSFAAPLTAAALAEAAYHVRMSSATRTITSMELRDALNASAEYFSQGDWEPLPRDRGQPVYDMVAYTTLPILTQAQMGWGYVNASMAPEIARRVLEQDFTIPPGKDQAMIFQPAWQQAREDYWAQYRS